MKQYGIDVTYKTDDYLVVDAEETETEDALIQRVREELEDVGYYDIVVNKVKAFKVEQVS